MRHNIYEKQAELTKIRHERNRVMRRLDGAEKQLKDALALREQTHQQLSKEQQDVVQLGKFSFINKLKEWTGKWDEQMEKEIQEVADAELKYHEAEKTAADLEQEVQSLRHQAKDPEFSFIEEEWTEFLKEKEAWIRQNDTDADRTLQKIAVDRVHLHSLRREITEAYDAGQTAVRSLDKALDKLDSAEGMSMWDTFLGGGLFVTAMKYSEMNSSEDLIHQAQKALRHYKTELLDVQNIASESFSVSQRDIFTMTDIFFDNIFSDWMVHSRIKETQNQMHDLLRDVQRVQDELARKRDQAEEELRRLDQQENDIITS